MCLLITRKVTPEKSVYRVFDEVELNIKIENKCKDIKGVNEIKNVIPPGFVVLKITPIEYRKYYDIDNNEMNLKLALYPDESLNFNFRLMAIKPTKDKYNLKIIVDEKEIYSEEKEFEVIEAKIVEHNFMAISGEISIEQVGLPNELVYLNLQLKNNLNDAIDWIYLENVVPEFIINSILFEKAKVKGFWMRSGDILIYEKIQPFQTFRAKIPMLVKDFDDLKYLVNIDEEKELTREIEPKVIFKYGDTLGGNREGSVFFGNHKITIDLIPKIDLKIKINGTEIRDKFTILPNARAEMTFAIDKVGGSLHELVLRDFIPPEFEVSQPPEVYIERYSEDEHFGYLARVRDLKDKHLEIIFDFKTPEKEGQYTIKPNIEIPELNYEKEFSEITFNVSVKRSSISAEVTFSKVFPVEINEVFDTYIKLKNNGEEFATDITLKNIDIPGLEVLEVKKIFPETKNMSAVKTEEVEVHKKLRPRGMVEVMIRYKAKEELAEIPAITVEWTENETHLNAIKVPLDIKITKTK